MAAMIHSCQILVLFMTVGLEALTAPLVRSEDKQQAEQARLAEMRGHTHAPQAKHVQVDGRGEVRNAVPASKVRIQRLHGRVVVPAQVSVGDQIQLNSQHMRTMHRRQHDIMPIPLQSYVIMGDAPEEFPKILHVGSTLRTNYSDLRRWHIKNPGWKVDLLNDERIDELSTKRFPETKAVLDNVTHGVEKSDIGRLLAIEAEGGIYFDSDVTVLAPMSKWATTFGYDNVKYDLILGIETPNTTYTNPLQITNWAMAAMPGNPIIRHAIDRIVQQAPSIPDTVKNIVPRTGPAALTSAILEYFQDHAVALPDMEEFRDGNGHLFDVKEDNGNVMKVLILPYRAFCMHPGNKLKYGNLSMENNLVRHSFLGRWREQPPEPPPSYAGDFDRRFLQAYSGAHHRRTPKYGTRPKQATARSANRYHHRAPSKPKRRR